MAHLITGYAGYEHIQSADEGSFNASFFGTGQYVMEAGNMFAGSIIDNNTVRILDGDILMYGRHIRINPNTYEDMTIETGTAGKNRIDLICMTYEKNAEDETEMAYLQVIKGTETAGTPSAPSYTNGDILQGETFNQMPLYSVKIEGVALSSITAIFDTIPSYKALADKYAAEFAQKCEDVMGPIGEMLDQKISDTFNDYIVASGTSGNWSYRKYNSGIAESWGYFTGTSDSNGYIKFTLTDPFTYLSSPAKVITVGGGAAGSISAQVRYTEKNSTGAQIYLYQGSATSGASGWVFVHVIGRWK